MHIDHVVENVVARARGETKVEDQVVDRVVTNAEKYGMTIEEYVRSLHRHVTNPVELRFWLCGWLLMIRENLEARSVRH